MKWKMALLLLALVSATGCLAIPAKRSPQLARPRVFPEVDGSPSIRLTVDDRSEQPKRTARALARSRKRFDFLQGAAGATVDPDYTIHLVVDATDEDHMGPCSVSFCLLPGWITKRVSVRATVADSVGDDLGEYHSIGQARVVTQMHLLWVLPATAPFVPVVKRNMWNNTFRDVFIQAGTAIQEDQAQGGQASSACAPAPDTRGNPGRPG